MYPSSIFEQMLTDVAEVDDDEGEDDDEQECSAVTKGIGLANAIIQKLVNGSQLESGNLLSAHAKILTAVMVKTQSGYPDLAKRLEEMMPMKGLVNGALFTGKGIKPYTELQREIASADEIRLMVSFIKKRGLALLLPRTCRSRLWIRGQNGT